MFFILLAIILIVVLSGLAWWNGWNAETLKPLYGMIACGAILLGVLLPVAGYTEPIVINETQLVSITDGKTIYVQYDANKGYGYCVEANSRFSIANKDYRILGISESDAPVRIEENDSCTTAILVFCKIKPKRNFWTFALAGTKYEHVFYIPTGTIEY